MVDIVSFVVKLVKDNNIDPSSIDIFKLNQAELKFEKGNAHAIMNLANRNPMEPIFFRNTVLKALQVMSSSGARRIPLHDHHDAEKRKMDNVLTESALVSWMTRHKEVMGEFTGKTIYDLGFLDKFDKSPLFSVKRTDSALTAFEEMDKNRISSIAVVNEEGQFVSSISAKDIYQIITDDEAPFAPLMKPAESFAVDMRQKSDISRYTTKSSEYFGDLIAKLTLLRLHRIYILDDKAKPIGVVSLSDIVKFFYKSATVDHGAVPEGKSPEVERKEQKTEDKKVVEKSDDKIELQTLETEKKEDKKEDKKEVEKIDDKNEVDKNEDKKEVEKSDDKKESWF